LAGHMNHAKVEVVFCNREASLSVTALLPIFIATRKEELILCAVIDKGSLCRSL